jgi:hypothetical protein
LIQNALFINKRKVIDFTIASIDTSIKIIPASQTTNQWKVMMNGLHLGTLQVQPSKLIDIASHTATLKDANYLAVLAPG